MAVDLRYATGLPVSGAGPVRIQCLNPDHKDRHPSMAVYDNGAYCFSCGAYYGEHEFLALLGVKPGDLPEIAARARVERTYTPDEHLTPQLLAWHRTLVDPSSPRRWRREWLIDKYGLWPETINKFQVGHTGTRFSIPIWQGEQAVGVRFRLDPEYNDDEALKTLKYFQPKGQPVLQFRPSSPAKGLANLVIMTEGEFDAMVMHQMGYDAITTTGGSGSLAKLLIPGRIWKTAGRELVIATDQDEAGEKAYTKLCEAWNQQLARLRWPRGKDITEALQHVDPYRRGSVLDIWIREARARVHN